MGEARGQPFVGRHGERKRLSEAFRLACEERAQVVVVGGEAGGGKSTLVDRFGAVEAAEMFGRSPLVVTGHCVDPDLAFVPVIEVLRSLAAGLGPAFDDVVGVARSEISALVPDLIEGGDPLAAASHERVFDAVTQVLARAARTVPVVVVIEDLHWADRATFDLVRYATLTLGPARVLLLLTVRDEEVRRAGPLRAWVGELARVRHVEVLALAPLTEVETGELVAALRGNPVRAAELHARSGGNPFFLAELLAADNEGRPGVPERVRDALAARLTAVPADALAVAAVAAVIGPTVPDALLAEVTDLEPAALRSALRALVDEGILLADEDRPLYRFRHALWQDAVLAELLAVERKELHRRVALTLEASPGLVEGGAQVTAPALAAHWQSAGDDRQALGSAVAAARVLVGMGLSPEASALFDRALGLWAAVADPETAAGTDQARILEEAAAAATHAGSAGVAVTRLRHARTLIDGDADPAHRNRLDARLGRALIDAGQEAEGIGLLDAVIATAGRDDEPSIGWALAWRARVELMDGRYAASSSLAERAAAMATASGDDRLLADALTTVGAAANDLVLLDRALELARRVGAVDTMVRALNNKIFAVIDATGAGAPTTSILAELDEVVALPMSATSRASALVGAAAQWCDLGRFADAEALVARVAEIDFAGPDGVENYHGMCCVSLCRGNFAAATACVDRMRAIVRDGSNDSVKVLLDEAILAWVRGASATARSALLNALPLAVGTDDEWQTRHYLLWTARTVAVAVEEAGAGLAAVDLAEVRDVADRLRQASAVVAAGTPHRLAIEAELEAFAGNVDPDRFGAAAAAFGTMSVAEAGWCRVREVDAALAVGDRRRAQAVLDDTYRSATATGFTVVVDQLADRAARAGLSVPGASPRTTDAAAGLTARERDVLVALAEGRTNREIASQLYLGVRTVETHVSRLLAKLGASDRRSAVDRARDLGLLDDVPPTR